MEPDFSSGQCIADPRQTGEIIASPGMPEQSSPRSHAKT